MTQKEEVQRKARRDLLLILLVLPFGILFMFLTGGVATRLAPEWMMKASMDSNLDPRVSFALKSDNPNLLEPLSAEILTPAAWANVFLTPNAYTPPEAPPPNQSAPQQKPPVAAFPPGTEAPPGGVPSTAPPPTEPPPPPPGGGGPPPGNGDPPPGSGGPPQGDTSADLDITNSSSDLNYAAGGSVSYTIIVTNNSSVSITNATLSIPIPSQVNLWGWCLGSPCTPTMTTTDLSTSITLAPTNSITYIVTANIKSPLAAANLVSTAQVTLPTGYVDVDTGTNTDTSNTVTIPPYLDLSISKTSSSSTYTGGEVFLSPPLYVVTVTNNSSFNVSGISVTDEKPNLLAIWGWACLVANPANLCNPLAIPTSNFTDTITLDAGEAVQYTVGATITGTPSTYMLGNIINKANVNVPTGFVDSVPGNNESSIVTHTPSNSISQINIGLPDSSYYSPGNPGEIIFTISPAIQADGTNLPDLVYYERLATSDRVEFDWVIVQISSDGSTWHEVFNWGDGNADINTNVNINNVLGAEDDNRVFLLADNILYNDMGVTIDIDAISGISTGLEYSWIRVIGPDSPGGDSAEVNAIQPYYP